MSTRLHNTFKATTPLMALTFMAMVAAVQYGETQPKVHIDLPEKVATSTKGNVIPGTYTSWKADRKVSTDCAYVVKVGTVQEVKECGVDSYQETTGYRLQSYEYSLSKGKVFKAKYSNISLPKGGKRVKEADKGATLPKKVYCKRYTVAITLCANGTKYTTK
jgi:hypothetical protein